MAKSWITDLWVKDALVELGDGTKQKVPPTPAQLKSLKSLPEQFRATKFGKGSRWRVSWEDATTKKTLSRVFSVKTEAEAYKAEMEDDIRMGRYIDPSDKERPFAEVAQLWIDSKRRVKGSTLARYRRELNNYVLPQWGTMPLGAITRVKIDAWVKKLQDGTAPHMFDVNDHIKNATRKPTKASATYVDHIVDATFGSVIRYAVKARWISDNPLSHVELPRPEAKDATLPVLSYRQVESLAADAYELRQEETDRALVLFLAYTGARISEALGLKIEDLDLDNLRASINRTWTTDEHDKKVIGPPKGWQKRRVPVQPFVADELKKITKGRKPGEWVFQSKRGVVIDRKRWYFHTWRKIMADGVYPDGLRVHDLRHTAASLAIAAGADVKIVQLMLGHKDATETLNIYGHMWPDKLGEVIDLMARRREQELTPDMRATGS